MAGADIDPVGNACIGGRPGCGGLAAWAWAGAARGGASSDAGARHTGQDVLKHGQCGHGGQLIDLQAGVGHSVAVPGSSHAHERGIVVDPAPCVATHCQYIDQIARVGG